MNVARTRNAAARRSALLRFPAAGEVHVWSVDLGAAATGPWLAECLSPDEIYRAARFRFPEHRRRFEAGRGSIRHILAGYLGMDPAVLRFRHGVSGKPEIAGADLDTLHFNVAHADEVLLCAVARMPLGIDIEPVSLPPEYADIAERFFAPSEYQRLLAIPPSQRPKAFTRCWTRKEAFIKAIGDGLSFPLDAFEVTLAPDEPARLLRIRRSEAEAGRWTMTEVETPPGYVGTLVVAGPGTAIRYRCFPEIRHAILQGTSG